MNQNYLLEPTGRLTVQIEHKDYGDIFHYQFIREAVNSLGDFIGASPELLHDVSANAMQSLGDGRYYCGQYLLTVVLPMPLWAEQRDSILLRITERD